MRILPSLLLTLPCTCASAQKIEVPKGYTPQVGVVVSMLEDLKRRVTRSVVNQ